MYLRNDCFGRQFNQVLVEDDRNKSPLLDDPVLRRELLELALEKLTNCEMLSLLKKIKDSNEASINDCIGFLKDVVKL